MKYILNYESKEAFKQKGNETEHEYMLTYAFPYKGGVMCREGIRTEEQASESGLLKLIIEESHGPFNFMGSVNEIAPGVAYCKEENRVYYNGEIALKQITIENAGEYTWEEVGMTEEIFNTYVRMFNEERHCMSEYNIKALEAFTSVYMYPANNATRMDFGSEGYTLSVTNDGDTKIVVYSANQK